MLRHLLLGLAYAMLSAVTLAAESPILLSCNITGAASESLSSFTDMFCEEAAGQLGEASGRAVQVVTGQTFANDQTQSWLRLDVAIRTQYAAHGKAIWGGGELEPGQGPELEAGIDDASLNQTTAAMLVQVMLRGTPFLSGK